MEQTNTYCRNRVMNKSLPQPEEGRDCDIGITQRLIVPRKGSKETKARSLEVYLVVIE